MMRRCMLQRSMENLYFQFLIFIIFGAEIVAGVTENAKVKCSYVDELYYPDNHCRSFYRCTHRGVRDVKQCGLNYVFDFHKQICTHQIAGGCHEPNCTGRTDGVHQDVAHGCHRSYVCHSKRVHSIDNCPAKHLHNGEKCAPQENVACAATLVRASTTTTTTTTTALALANSAEERICVQQGDGVHSDPTSADCTTYIVCKGGRLMARKRCSNQAAFDGASCVPSVVFQCPATPRDADSDATESENGCQHRTDGLWPSPMHGCKSYVQCANGRQVRVKDCAGGQYFDAEVRECVLTEQPLRRCFDLGPSLDCEQAGDGLHVADNCEAYYHCHRGRKTEYRCSAGKLYNGSTCVPRAQYSCARPAEGGDGFCQRRADGYYKDASNDGCRTYHYCSSGYQITYLCEPGHIFDERSGQCVRPPAGEYEHRCQLRNPCHGKSDGYHADLLTDCRDYFYCKSSEKLTQLTCRDKVFNGQECVAPHVYTCPSRHNHRQLNCLPMRCAQQCQRHRNGFYIDLKSNCRDYFSCIDGKRSRLSCTGGKRFNGEICVAEDKFLCPVFCDARMVEHGGDCLGGYMI